MKQVLSLLACLLISFALHAQKKISGRVYDALTKAPLSGASISSSGKLLAYADKDGSFTLECGATNRISVSYVSYESVQININNCEDEINIGLLSTSKPLNEVEITATSNKNKSILYQPVSLIKLNTTELKR